jgi:four helix bundle protein
MTELKNQKQYDLEERTLAFAKQARHFVNILPKTIGNIEDGKQFIRSSGSVGANYIEANDAVSKKDFIYRIRICRKEAKESRFWLQLLDTNHMHELEGLRAKLFDEATELMKIYGAILSKSL